VTLLSDVSDAADRYRNEQRRADEAVEAARDELRAKIRAARDEGLSFAAIARSAGFSLEYVRRLYAGS
jgi:hypothetical protein